MNPFTKQKTKKGKGLRRIIPWVVSFVIGFGLLEVSYRYQWVDYYRTEFEWLNEVAQNNKTRHILVGGDSFSAWHKSYVNALRDSFPEYSVINSSVPGTGVIQASYILPGRIREFSPDIFIYQIYAGNDLSDIHHPCGGDQSTARKIYWMLSDRFRVLSFINYRLGGARNTFNDLGEKNVYSEQDTFSSAKYNSREKILLSAEPSLLENTLFLQGGRAMDYLILKSKLQEITALLPKSCTTWILIIPHPAQVNKSYFLQSQMIGADYKRPLLNYTTYPLYDLIRKDFPDAVVLDPLQEFRKLSEGKSLYFANDIHLTEHGQKVLGRFVTAQLKLKYE